MRQHSTCRNLTNLTKCAIVLRSSEKSLCQSRYARPVRIAKATASVLPVAPILA